MKLIKYEASWCGPCKALDSIIEAADLKIEIKKIDIDQNVKCAKDNDIRSIPTIVLMDGDKEVARKSGLLTIDEFKEFANG